MRALVGILCLAVVVAPPAGTGATFTTSSTSPVSSIATLSLAAAEQDAPASGIAGTVGLSWSASSSATSASVTYYVLRRAAGSGSYAIVAGPTTDLHYTDLPAADGAYEYVVRTAASSFTAETAPQTATSDRTVPSSVTLSAASGALGGDPTVEISWTAAVDATSGVATYAVYHAEVLTLLGPCPAAGSADYSHTILTDELTTALSVVTTLALTYHCFYVVAHDAVGNESAASNVTGPTASH